MCTPLSLVLILQVYMYSYKLRLRLVRGFPGGASGKEPAWQAGDLRDTAWIPGSGRPLEEGMAIHSRILTGELHGQRVQAGLCFKKWENKWSYIYNYICIHIYSYCRYIKYPWKHTSESIILVNEEEIRTGYFSLTYLKVKLKNTKKLNMHGGVPGIIQW